MLDATQLKGWGWGGPAKAVIAMYWFFRLLDPFPVPAKKSIT